MAFDFFTMASLESFQYPHELFRDLLEMEEITPAVRNRTDLPEAIRTAYSRDQRPAGSSTRFPWFPRRFHGDAYPLSGGTLEITQPVGQIEIVYPETRILETEKQGGKTIVKLPEFTLQQIIICGKGGKGVSA